MPEALTQGNTYSEALEMAADALATALEFYEEDGRALPVPSKLTNKQILITAKYTNK